MKAPMSGDQLLQLARDRGLVKPVEGNGDPMWWLTHRKEVEAAAIPGAEMLAHKAAGRVSWLVDSLVALVALVGLAGEFGAKPNGTRLSEGLRELAGTPLGVPLATVAHVSDMHVTGPGARLVSGGPSGNDALNQLWLASQPALHGADVILVTGDLTDTGAADEWELAMRHLALVPRERVLVIPGNHDVSIVARDKWSMEGESGFLRAVRLLRMIAAMDAIQGDRAHILAGDGLVALSIYLDPYRDMLAEFTIRPTYFRKQIAASKVRAKLGEPMPPPDIAYSLISMVWQEVFPQCVELADRKLVFFLLNSNELGSNIVDNALGSVDSPQLGRLRKMMERYSEWSQVVLLHHHLALPPFDEGAIPGAFARLMVLLNAAEVLTLLASGQDLAVFHGHRHIAFRGTIENSVQIVSAASASLGDEVTGAAPKIDLYNLFRSAAGGTLVQAEPVAKRSIGL
jgi:hypothetical protein